MTKFYQVIQEGTNYDSHVAGHYDMYVIGTFDNYETASNLAQELDYQANLIDRDDTYWYNIRISCVEIMAYSSIAESEGVNPESNYNPEED